MFKHILIPTDGSDLAEKAVKAGVDFAKSIGAKVTGFCAIEEFPLMYGEYGAYEFLSPEEWRASEEKWAKDNLDTVAAYARTAQVPHEAHFARGRSVHEAVIKAAQDHGCDMIFIASHGRRGLAGLLLGSETMKVLTHCKIPVLVYR
jgi:nucleotide-binding universal stress UspA family protein